MKSRAFAQFAFCARDAQEIKQTDPRMSARVYVGNLSSRTRERDLEDFFRRYHPRYIDLKGTFAFVV